MTPDSGAAAPSVASPLADTARIALVGNPNSGKTALFNALTGSRQKVANYAGVTVERKEGVLTAPSGRSMGRLQSRGSSASMRPASATAAWATGLVAGTCAAQRFLVARFMRRYVSACTRSGRGGKRKNRGHFNRGAS